MLKAIETPEVTMFCLEHQAAILRINPFFFQIIFSQGHSLQIYLFLRFFFFRVCLD